jgi:hypothetical protein
MSGSAEDPHTDPLLIATFFAAVGIWHGLTTTPSEERGRVVSAERGRVGSQTARRMEDVAVPADQDGDVLCCGVGEFFALARSSLLRSDGCGR